MQLCAASVGGGPVGSGTSGRQLNPGLGREHREQQRVVVLPVGVSKQFEAEFDDGLHEPAATPFLTCHSARALDEAFSFIVRSTFAAGFRHPPHRSCWRLFRQTAWAGCAGRP